MNYRIKKLFCPQVHLARINLNKASLEELISSRCLPVKTSRRIIEYRLKNGDFSSLETLKKVKGVGDKRYEKLREIFFVE